MLRDHPDIGENGHEVAVAGPTRDDMHMNVIRDPRAGNRAEIPADIEPLGRADFTQHRLAANQHLVDLKNLMIAEPGRI